MLLDDTNADDMQAEASMEMERVCDAIADMVVKEYELNRREEVDGSDGCGSKCLGKLVVGGMFGMIKDES